MIYNVAQMLKAPVGATLDVALDPADRLELGDDRMRLAGDVAGSVRLHRTNQGILADGSATAPVELTCDRCLEPYTTAISFPLREQYYPTVDVVTGVELAAPASETAFGISPNHTLDLREALRQNLLLALPMQSLCRPDCAGLCPQCGRNRNTDPCDCVPESGDDRFAALRALLD
ncbi:MAG TPA: YceD family protein [Ktedonobacterales bacterium]|nr:YceD family protein [Ktedonobacterales bacterium]